VGVHRSASATQVWKYVQVYVVMPFVAAINAHIDPVGLPRRLVKRPDAVHHEGLLIFGQFREDGKRKRLLGCLF